MRTRSTGPGVVLETLRHLRLRQIRYQIQYRLPSFRVPSGPLPLAWKQVKPRLARPKNTRRASYLGGDVFRFNNDERHTGGAWKLPGARKLWHYNLHYMSWIFDLNEGREEWIRKWMEENPRSSGGDGWEPYPLSLRLFNWCKHFCMAGRAPDDLILDSMGRQAATLLSRLEFHLGANHLLENLLALGFIGFFLDTGNARATRARRKIGRLLEAELVEQFLPDGGHFELSPMYHAILLERMLDLLNYWPGGEDPYPGLKPELEERCRKGLAWLDAMSVDGDYSLFNDSAYDPGPNAGMLLEYGSELLGCPPSPAGGLRSLPESGYHRADAGPFTLIFDAGPLGPDYQLGHAQCDLLSFCLWLGNHPVIIHPGCFEYVPGRMRDHCRSTAAHNTVVVDGAEQADWWASHRVGWRGRTREASARVDGAGAILLEATHDGFSRLPGKPRHKRVLRISPDAVEVEDAVLSGRKHAAEAHFHFHPDCLLERLESGLEIRTQGGVVHMKTDGRLRIGEGWWAPEFGKRIRCHTVSVEFGENACRTAFWVRRGAPA